MWDAKTLADLGYLVAAALFIIGIKFLSSPRTAVRGNHLGAAGMLLAVLITLARMAVTESPMAPGELPQKGIIGWPLIAIGLWVGGSVGYVLARRIASSHAWFTRSRSS